MRTNSFGARFEHLSLRAFEDRGLFLRNFWMNDAEDVLIWQRIGIAVIDKISFFRDAEIFDGRLGFFFGEELLQFGFGPGVEFSFLAFTVGVFGRKESALRMRHIAQDIPNNVARNL